MVTRAKAPILILFILPILLILVDYNEIRAITKKGQLLEGRYIERFGSNTQHSAPIIQFDFQGERLKKKAINDFRFGSFPYEQYDTVKLLYAPSDSDDVLVLDTTPKPSEYGKEMDPKKKTIRILMRDRVIWTLLYSLLALLLIFISSIV